MTQPAIPVHHRGGSRPGSAQRVPWQRRGRAHPVPGCHAVEPQPCPLVVLACCWFWLVVVGSFSLPIVYYCPLRSHISSLVGHLLFWLLAEPYKLPLSFIINHDK